MLLTISEMFRFFLGAALVMHLTQRVESRPQYTWGSQMKDEPTCGYMSCPAIKDDMINVHLVPHTHDDVGWLKTVDQYYYGDKNDIQHAGVQYILDSVVQELVKDPTKRFIYVEIAYFARWWREQDSEMRANVVNLVTEGRLEFALGGWSMNDEATTHYNAIIDQHTLGLQFLQEYFGECGRPRVAWQIDPFGHSREQASLFAQMGYDGLFIGRLDHQDKNLRLNQTNMEFVWHGSPNNLGKDAELFTGVLYNGYDPPEGFCWDETCNDDPIMDDDKLHGKNVEKKVSDFIKAAQDQARHYHSNNIMMTMGSDFQYGNAHTWFKNMDKLIQYVNAQQSNGSNINVLYSTPSCYLYNVNHLNQIWNSKFDDFFPYSERIHSYWTGYYTSRAALKGYVRKTNNFLQVCNQVTTFNNMLSQPTDIDLLKEAMGVVQHHDAISGTEKQHVANDYAQRLAEGIDQCEILVVGYGRMMSLGSPIGVPQPAFCPLLNISSCDFEGQQEFVVLAYNPLARDVRTYLRIPVYGNGYGVTDANDELIPSQIVTISNRTKSIPERRGSNAMYEVVFQASLPPLGFTLFFLGPYSGSRKTKSHVAHSDPAIEERKEQPKVDRVIKNEYLSLTFDETTGLLKSMQNLETNVSINLRQEYMYYLGFQGNNSKEEFQSSGAYIFRPNGTVPKVFSHADIELIVYPTEEDLVVQEVHQKFSPWVTQVVRLYKGERHAEFEWTVGPIPINDSTGKEVISRFSTDLGSFGVFYTDANGREIIQRRINHRDTWPLNVTEFVSSNYYPVNSRIYIRDETKNIQFTVMTDRSQGGTSLFNGQVELMIHRRLLNDDNRGIGEPLNETGADGQGLIVRGKHYVILDTISRSAALHRELGLRLYMAPSLAFMDGGPQPVWVQNWGTKWTGANVQLPRNVHLLTFDMWSFPEKEPIMTREILFRLEHIYEEDEDPVLSQPVSVNMNALLKHSNLTWVQEVTLGANLPLEQLKRLDWVSMPPVATRRRGKVNMDNSANQVDPTAITLQPMQIRTFRALKDYGGN